MEKNKQQIISKERVKQYAEVFTNEREVKAMCDLFPAEIWGNVGSTFLEPCVGEGAFVIEVLKRKFLNCKKRTDFTKALKSVYGMDIQADNVQKTINNIIELCNDYFQPTKEEIKIINMHIMQADSLKVMEMLANYGGKNDN